ncbi:SH2 domain-containing protein 7 [Apteryx mantelli]|uniref:SH2 domain-containing protein 7 n=2 Tax=Palaeognathae TaxID=8783 RepID=A0ABM4FAI1_9AVES|nr:SH2 domain-containing protein 7-like [Apteryx rowi]
MERKKQQLLLGKETSSEIANQSSETLKEIVLKWFLETQAAIILENGTFPEWFHGFITRKQTEDMLRDRDVGCFLIRLSDRAIGYILSYRGKDRCRHFVINHLSNGHYVVSGDTCTHESLAELISYYQTSVIEPFGESLTIAYAKTADKSIYDDIAWDQKNKPNNKAIASLLVKKMSGSSTATVPVGDTYSNSDHSEKLLDFSSRSKRTFQDHSQKAEDSDIAPPLPERSSLLTLETFRHDTDRQDNIVYAELNKRFLTDTAIALKMHTATEKLLENSACLSTDTQWKHGTKISTVYAMTKQTEHTHSKNTDLLKPSPPEIVYAELQLQQCKNHSFLHSQTLHSLTLPLSSAPETKLSLNSPASLHSAFTPKLPNKARFTTESQSSEEQLTAYETSFHCSEGLRKSDEKVSYESLTHRMYGQIEKMKSGFDNVSTVYERIPTGWLKSFSSDQASERICSSFFHATHCYL